MLDISDVSYTFSKFFSLIFLTPYKVGKKDMVTHTTLSFKRTNVQQKFCRTIHGMIFTWNVFYITVKVAHTKVFDNYNPIRLYSIFAETFYFLQNFVILRIFLTWEKGIPGLWVSLERYLHLIRNNDRFQKVNENKYLHFEGKLQSHIKGNTGTDLKSFKPYLLWLIPLIIFINGIYNWTRYTGLILPPETRAIDFKGCGFLMDFLVIPKNGSIRTLCESVGERFWWWESLLETLVKISLLLSSLCLETTEHLCLWLSFTFYLVATEFEKYLEKSNREKDLMQIFEKFWHMKSVVLDMNNFGSTLMSLHIVSSVPFLASVVFYKDDTPVSGVCIFIYFMIFLSTLLLAAEGHAKIHKFRDFVMSRQLHWKNIDHQHLLMMMTELNSSDIGLEVLKLSKISYSFFGAVLSGVTTYLLLCLQARPTTNL